MRETKKTAQTLFIFPKQEAVKHTEGAQQLD